MDSKVLTELYSVVENRKKNFEEGSYTCYLFSQGLDKILKKVGEESAETIIAAKNLQNNAGTKEELVGEVSDLIYHLTVMLSCLDVPITDVLQELEVRSQKIGNKKQMKKVDRNT